ncbi:unnamed protein product [Adineta ricciae]|uniref:Uncharacterized protein n=1 Tax=Adineta ricciae TaxID=249248 RepID=A0A814S0W5_ADIRI|nr:unnamed protein product [Adineta ricciae]
MIIVIDVNGIFDIKQHKINSPHFVFSSFRTMHFLPLLLSFPCIYASTSGGGHNSASPASPAPTNDLGLTFGHTVNKRDQHITVYFDIGNLTLKEYRYYYFDFRPFGSYGRSEYLPRQRLIDSHNSLRIVGLHDGDYISCVTFIDEYGTVFKPRFACYEFTLGEKTVGAHHGSTSGYLAPLLFAFAFVLHVLIAVVHHIKAKKYAHKLLYRFMNVSRRSNLKRIYIQDSLKELDHPHLSASIQRRLSRVTIDANEDSEFERERSYSGHNAVDELPLYTIPYHNGRTMDVIPEHEHSNTLDSVSSMRHLIDTAPWNRRTNRSASSSIRRMSP